MEKTVFTDIPNQAGSSLAYSPSIFFDIRNSRWTNATGRYNRAEVEKRIQEQRRRAAQRKADRLTLNTIYQAGILAQQMGGTAAGTSHLYAGMHPIARPNVTR